MTAATAAFAALPAWVQTITPGALTLGLIAAALAHAWRRM